MNEKAALLRSNSRCEWIYLNGERCQNAMSLKFHHRTYDRYGHELPEDFSVFCPAHHVIADIYRKQAIGQREDIISEYMARILWNKIMRLDYKSQNKFLLRVAREWDNFFSDIIAGKFAENRFMELIEAGSISENSLYLSDEDIVFVLLAIRYIRLCSKIISIPYLDQMSMDCYILEQRLTPVV